MSDEPYLLRSINSQLVIESFTKNRQLTACNRRIVGLKKRNAELKRQLSEVRALCGRAARIPAIVREIEDHRQAGRWAEKNDAVAILDKELDRFDAASKGGEG